MEKLNAELWHNWKQQMQYKKHKAGVHIEVSRYRSSILKQLQLKKRKSKLKKSAIP